MRRKADVTRASCHDVPAVTYGTDAGTICARFASTLTQRTPKETARIAGDFTKLPASAFEGCKIDAKSYVDLSVVEEADERA